MDLHDLLPVRIRQPMVSGLMVPDLRGSVRLLEPIGNIPPVELEEVYYRSQDAPAEMAGLT